MTPHTDSLVLSERFPSVLAEMLRLQTQVNDELLPDWRTRDLAWCRAIYVEAVEFLEHLGQWKWWKAHKAPDIAQAQMELIDIWHFGLSHYLEDLAPEQLPEYAEQLARHIRRAMHVVQDDDGLGAVLTPAGGDVEQLHRYVDRLMASASADDDFDVLAFCALMRGVGLTWEALSTQYLGKATLNRFRKDHGYQTQSYRKVWAGKEDNEHLTELLAALPVERLTYEYIYVALKQRYFESEG